MTDPTYKGLQDIPTKVTATVTVSSVPVNWTGILLSHDGTNDPTFTVYNAAAATAGTEIYSGTWTDSDRPIGWVSTRIRMDTGLHIVVSNIGSGFFTVFHNTHFVLKGGA